MKGEGGTQVGPSGFVRLRVTGEVTGLMYSGVGDRTLLEHPPTSPNTADCVSADDICSGQTPAGLGVML